MAQCSGMKRVREMQHYKNAAWIPFQEGRIYTKPWWYTNSISGQPVSNFRLEINRDILISGIILEEFQSGIGLVGGKALIFWQSNDLT